MKKIILPVLVLSLCFIFTCCGSDDSADTTAAADTTASSASESNTDTADTGASGESTVTIGSIFDDEQLTLAPITEYKPADVKIDPDLIAGGLIDIDDIEALEPAEIEFFIQAKDDLVANLATAFANAGINVDINRETGEMSVDSTVLFGGDSAVLSEEGKAFLNKFTSAYTSVVCTEAFDGLISKLMVEGHTAPVEGTSYEDDIPLSQERADNVKNYCLSSDTGLSPEAVSELTATMKAEGLSNGTPVKDSAGNVDMDASRRVAFRFVFDPEYK